MGTIKTLALAATLIMMPMSLALADCADPTSASDQPKTAPVAKDGSKAPLQTPAAGSAETPVEQNSAQKDGSTMPLATEEGGGDKDLATSQQDVEAQQRGEKTAAAEATEAKEDCPDQG